jgi:uncharacterized protein (UPF0261 family)
MDRRPPRSEYKETDALSSSNSAAPMTTVAILGTLDTKGREHAFVAEQIRARGHQVLIIDVGMMGAVGCAPDVTAIEVAAAGEIDLAALVQAGDRGRCVAAMAQAAPVLLKQLHAKGEIDAVLSLGGGGGTAIATAAMRALPLGVPKLMVSTLASGNTAPYIGTSDLVMMPSIVDVAGLNRVSKMVFGRAAAAISGMVEAAVEEASDMASADRAIHPGADGDDRPLIAASMFGNTTDCVNAAIPLLEAAGFEVLVFHATGTGGKAMEALVRSGMVSAVLDITTTEWADEWVGGVLSAGPDRLDATAEAKVPSIVVPGCLDMVNFGEPDTVPKQFEGRTFYHHNPQVTLMRTNAEECAELGRILAKKVNRYSAPVSVLLPAKAVSVISAEGQPFYDPQADEALFDGLMKNLESQVELLVVNCEINDPAFAEACAKTLLQNIARAETSA